MIKIRLIHVSGFSIKGELSLDTPLHEVVETLKQWPSVAAVEIVSVDRS